MASIRLQKYFTDCGIMSRRAAEEQIKLGKVKINGRVAVIGDTVDPDLDLIEFGGKIIVPQIEEKICVMLNKPRGYVTTMSDEKGRKNVSLLVKDLGIRVYPVGRLDMDSDGLLLMTNDGELANSLTHPKHEIPKIYHVTVKGKVSPQAINILSSEMVLDGYKIMPVEVKILRADSNTTVLCMTLYEGRNRQIRKMCDAANLKITRLSRVAIGELRIGALPSGKWRKLNPKELSYLRSDGKRKD